MHIMKPGHPLWQEFCDKLEGPEGCNFREDNDGKTIWNCPGGYEKPKATAILETMADVDINASLKFFTAHGGHCDCEILFNVA